MFLFPVKNLGSQEFFRHPEQKYLCVIKLIRSVIN